MEKKHISALWRPKARQKRLKVKVDPLERLKLPAVLENVSIFYKTNEHLPSGTVGKQDQQSQHFAMKALLAIATSCKNKKPCLIVKHVDGTDWIAVIDLEFIETVQYIIKQR
jgi:hypothetical protein